MSYLKSIAWPGNNSGSLIELKIIPISDVEGEPRYKGDTLYGAYTLAAGKGFVSWKVASQGIGIKTDSKTGQEGISKNTKLSFFIPKDRSGIRIMLDRAEMDKFIIHYKDGNGVSKIFGTRKRPVSFLYSRDSGTSFSGMNAYSCQFYYEGPNNDFFFNQTIAAPPGSVAPAIVRVNGVVVATLAPGESVNFDSDFDFTFEIVGT